MLLAAAPTLVGLYKFLLGIIFYTGNKFLSIRFFFSGSSQASPPKISRSALVMKELNYCHPNGNRGQGCEMYASAR